MISRKCQEVFHNAGKQFKRWLWSAECWQRRQSDDDDKSDAKIDDSNCYDSQTAKI